MTVALGVLAAVLAVAGCGGGGGGGKGERLTKEEYEAKIQAADKQTTEESTAFGLLLGQLAQSDKSVKLDKVAQATEKTQKAAREGADLYESLNPPEEVEDLNKRLADATRAFADDLDELKNAAADDDRGAAEKFAKKVTTGDLDSIGELAKVGLEFQKKGYKLTS